MARLAHVLALAVLATSCGDRSADAPAASPPPLAKPAFVPAPATMTVAGTVVDQATGKGVDHVEVVLRGESGEQTVLANTSGEFQLKVAPGLYSAYARGNGVLSIGLAERVRLDHEPRRELAGKLDEALLPVLDARRDLAGVELSVVAAATVTGTVLDASRRAMDGAIVRLVPIDRFTSQLVDVRPVLGSDVAVADAEGRFVLRVPAGTYLLDATHPQLAGVRDTEITLHAGQQLQTEVGLVPGCIISGRVVNADGSPGSDGAIERLGTRSGGFGPAGRIDAGAFRWVTTEEEMVTLRAWPWRSPPSPAKTFDCRDGKRFTDVVLRIPDQRPDISGVIVDADDRPVPLAYLDVHPLDPFIGGQQERADATGTWHVYDMPPARYRITASAPGHGIVDTMIVAPRHDLRLTLGGTGRIVGTTTDLVTGSVQVSFVHCGPKDQPLSIAHEPRIVPVVSGKFVIERAPACSLALALRWRDRVIESTVIVEPDRTSYIDVEIGEPREKTVTGIVRNAAGDPVGGARVTAVVREREAATVRTDAEGRYTVKTHAGAQLVAGTGDAIGRAVVGRANVATEQVDLVLDGSSGRQ